MPRRQSTGATCWCAPGYGRGWPVLPWNSVLWLAFLAVVPLAEGVLLGMMGIVTVMLGGRVLFGERFTRPRLIGVSLIVLGVALVGAGGN